MQRKTFTSPRSAPLLGSAFSPASQKTHTASSIKLDSSPSPRTSAGPSGKRSPSASVGTSQLAAFKAKHGLGSVKSQRFTSGARVQHPTRGAGSVVEIDSSARRNKPYKVRFDSGEVQHYSEETSAKLQVTNLKEIAPSIKKTAPSSQARVSSAKTRNVVAAAPVFREGWYQDAPSEPADRGGEPSVVVDDNKTQHENGKCLPDGEDSAAKPQLPDSTPELPMLLRSSSYSPPPTPKLHSPTRNLCMLGLIALPQEQQQDALTSQSSEACHSHAHVHSMAAFR